MTLFSLIHIVKTNEVCLGAEWRGVMIRLGGSNTENEVNKQESNLQFSLIMDFYAMQCSVIDRIGSFMSLYLQTSVTSKFTKQLLVTDVCQQQIYRLFASDRRLSVAKLPTFCY